MVDRPVISAHCRRLPRADPVGGRSHFAGHIPLRGQNWVVRAPEFRSELRGAVYRGDGPAVIALVGDQLLPGDALQLIGDGLVAALALQTLGAADLAGACAQALRERGWDGDDEL